jgi:hypothetical protein
MPTSPHHFDIARDSHGLWRVIVRDGPIGGTFRSEKDAVHFAMDEAYGDGRCIHRIVRRPAQRR